MSHGAVAFATAQTTLAFLATLPRPVLPEDEAACRRIIQDGARFAALADWFVTVSSARENKGEAAVATSLAAAEVGRDMLNDTREFSGILQRIGSTGSTLARDTKWRTFFAAVPEKGAAVQREMRATLSFGMLGVRDDLLICLMLEH